MKSSYTVQLSPSELVGLIGMITSYRAMIDTVQEKIMAATMEGLSTPAQNEEDPFEAALRREFGAAADGISAGLRGSPPSTASTEEGDPDPPSPMGFRMRPGVE